LPPLEHAPWPVLDTGKYSPVSPLIRRGNRFGIPARAPKIVIGSNGAKF